MRRHRFILSRRFNDVRLVSRQRERQDGDALVKESQKHGEEEPLQKVLVLFKSVF